jgi:hypothetical protein
MGDGPTRSKFPYVTQPIHRILAGSVDIAICDNDVFIYRLGYHITIHGRIAFAATGSIQDYLPGGPRCGRRDFCPAATV